MKKIFGLVLALVIVISVLGVVPAMAADEPATIANVSVHLDEGINLVYELSNGELVYVPVAAKEMNTVKGPVGFTEGVTSVKGYAQGILADDNTSVIIANLVNAMLNYGAAAQNYFGAETGTLVGTPVTDVTALKGATAPEVTVTGNEENVYIGATLVLEGTMQLRFYFAGTDIKVNYEDNEQDVTGTNTEHGWSYFDIPVMPYAMEESVVVSVGNTTVTYAPINYLKAKADDAELSEMVASIYAYGVAAKAYYIEYKCEHKSYDVTEYIELPTLFSDGTAYVDCKICGKNVLKSVGKAPATTHVYEYTGTGKTEPHYGTANIGEALGDKTFQPGNDLFLEFSVLLNNTTDNLNGEAFGLGHIFKDANLTQKVKEFAWFHYRPQWKWCPFKGGFDFSEVKSIPFGPQYQKGTEGDENPNPDYYVVLENYEGWHRFGLQYTQNFYQDASGNVTKHDVTVTVYVDGVKVTEAIMEWGDMFYTATLVDGTLTYTQNPNIASYYAVYYNIASGYLNKASDPTAYFPFGDFSLSVGDSFAMIVKPVEDPELVTYSPLPGVYLNGTAHYEICDKNSCLAGNHYWATEPTVDVAPTCTTAGSKSNKCYVCGATDLESVVAIDALGHAWATEYTVDKEVTCVTDGEESIKCTVCNAINPESVRPIESAGQHVWAEGYTVVTVPTVFAEGYRTGTCTECNEAIEGPVDKTEMTLHTYTYTGAGKAEPHYMTGNIGEALDGKEFGPGNDLYLEFSVLLNNTTDKLNGEAFGFGHIAKKENPNAEGAIWDNFSWFHYRAHTRWCNFKGGFDFSEVDKFTYGPVYKEYGTAENIVALETYEGWHRMGLQYTQNVYENNGSFTYDVTVTVYLDGVMVSETVMNWSSLFYSAKREGGEIVYTQNPDIADYYVVFYNIASGYIKNEGDPDAYFPFGDFSLSVGDSFAMPVAPVENPESATFTPAEGAAPMDATVHFEHRYMDDCLAGNHTYTGKFTVDYNATCTTAGQKSYKCEICGNVKTEAIEPAGQHVWADDGTVVTVPTVFSEGVKASTCSVCGDPVTEAIGTTKANLNTYTSTNATQKCETVKIGDALDDGETFQPGKDLYLEFSILLNDTNENVNNNGIGWGHIAKDAKVATADKEFSWFYYRADAVWCPFKGGFEFSGQVTKFYGPEWVKIEGDVTVNRDNYVILDEYNGWHRFGLKYTQNFTQDANGNVTGHYVTITVYVDGVEVNKMDMNWGAYFYEAKLVNGELTYTQNANIEDLYVVVYNLASAKLYSKSKPAYFPIADVYVTVGDGFVVDVSPATDPVVEDFNQDGVTLEDVKQHFVVNK